MAESKIRIGQVNSLETQLGTIYTQANNAYTQANAAYDAANNAQVTVYQNSSSSVTTQTVNFVNTATITVSVSNDNGNANIALTAVGGAAFDQANAAREQANTARSDANTTFATINTTFGTVNTEISTANTQANSGRDQANNAYAQANAARDQANSAYTQANAAYLAANNANLLLGGVITGTLNVTQDIIVGGNVYLEGNTTFINVATYAVEDSLIYLASNNQLTDSVDIGFMGGKNTSGTYAHTGLARDATDGKWKLFDGLPEEGHIGNVINFNNSYLATLVANVEANTLSVVNGVSGNVNFDSGTLFVDSVGDRIGIGTTNPLHKLVIVSPDDPASGNNGIRIIAASGSNNLRLGNDVGNSYIQSGNSKPLHINPLGNDTLLNPIGGNVSIGVSNTSQRLYVGITSTDLANGVLSSSNSYPIARFMNHASGGGIRGLEIGGPTGGIDTPVYVKVAGTSARFSVLNDAGTEQLTVLNGGNVGIGTTSPGSKLDVFGGIRSTTSSTTGTALIEALNDLGTMVLQTGLFGSTKSGTTFGLNNANLAFMYTTTYSSGHPSALAIGTSSSQPLVFGTGAVERMRIDGSGNVGIGTTSPVDKLDVLGDNGSTSNWGNINITSRNVINAQDRIYTALRFNDSGSGDAGAIGYAYDGSGYNMRFATVASVGGALTERMMISRLGNVGVGTTNPGARLDVYPGASSLGSAGANGIRVHRPNAYGNYGYLEYLPGSQDAVLGSTYGGGAHGRIFFRTHDTSAGTSRDAMLINDSGNVGINTTSPAERLHVVGRVIANAVSELSTSPAISSGTLTLDLAESAVFTVSLNANITTLTLNNIAASGRTSSFVLVLTADGTARTVTWPGSFKWPGGTAPTLTSTLNKIDIITAFTTNGGTNWYAFATGQNL